MLADCEQGFDRQTVRGVVLDRTLLEGDGLQPRITATEEGVRYEARGFVYMVRAASAGQIDGADVDLLVGGGQLEGVDDRRY